MIGGFTVTQHGRRSAGRTGTPGAEDLKLMAVEVYHHDSVHTTLSTRDRLPSASVTSKPPRVSGVNSMQEEPQTTSSFGSSVKKRRLSKPKAGRSLARSISTPQLRGNVMSDSDADKKRNKLGYQRISIACGMSNALRISSIWRRETGTQHAQQGLLTNSSALSKAKDSLLGCRGRPTVKVSKLHSTQEGVRVLSCRTAKCDREQVAV